MKGILFKPDMIKAIVEGRKTQTRRVMPQFTLPSESGKPYLSDGYLSVIPDRINFKGWAWIIDDKGKKIKPGYQVGEVVYIKETLYRHPYLDEAGYMLDQTPVFINQTIGDWLKWRWQKDILTGMFMPQEAARYFIKITGVRAERLQEITYDDIVKEGWQGQHAKAYVAPSQYVEYSEDIMRDARIWYKELWDTINPKYLWASNPWVWQYEFKLVEKP